MVNSINVQNLNEDISLQIFSCVNWLLQFENYTLKNIIFKKIRHVE